MKKILVIEDNDDNLYLIKFILEKNGFEVVYAQTGLGGVQRAIEEKPDLIIMDIQLPDINGLEATRKIRSGEAGSKIPIIALTSYAMAGDKERALQSGCTGYIEKPIEPETIMQGILKYL